jgi:hypothetical protein
MLRSVIIQITWTTGKSVSCFLQVSEIGGKRRCPLLILNTCNDLAATVLTFGNGCIDDYSKPEGDVACILAAA